MRKYRLIAGILFIMIPIAFLVGVLSGQWDVIHNQVITNDTYKQGAYTSEYNGKTYNYYYENENSNVMNEINYQIDTACGSDVYCRDLYVRV